MNNCSQMFYGKRIISPVSRPSRDLLFDDIMNMCNRYSQLNNWEKEHVLRLVAHKIMEGEAKRK